MSKAFLDDIVEIFALTHTETKEHWENGEIKGYYLDLGAEFFNELLDNYEESLARKRRRYFRICHKFPLEKNKLEKMLIENPIATGKELAELIYEETHIKVGRRTVLQKLVDWNIERVTKIECQREKIIDLRRKGWSLEKIWLDTDIGLGLSETGWKKNRWRFFKRVFKKDKNIINKKGSIIERIEEVYNCMD